MLLGSFALLLLLLVVGPKFTAVCFVNRYLWGSVRGTEHALVLAQDLVLWWGLLGLSAWVLPKLSLRGWILWWMVLGSLFFLLLIDMRVRQIWLKPLDLGMVLYYVEEWPILRSSTGWFFASEAGFGLSFRRLLMLAMVGHTLLGCVMLGLLAGRPTADLPDGRGRWRAAAWLLGAVGGVLLALMCPRQGYGLQDNVVVSRLLGVITPARTTRSRVDFEQPLRPASDVLAAPRTRLAVPEVDPFDNLVIVVLESFRYREFEFETGASTPNLGRFAREGLHAKAYVSVPHSSKALYAILSGRNPSARVEILESVPLEQASMVRTLRDHRGAATWTFSTAFLGFENTDGLLRSVGIDERVGPDELERLSRRTGSKVSYGVDDAMLVDVPARTIAADGRRPFVSVLLTLNSHHPYVYPGKRNEDGDGKESYRRAVEYGDRVLGNIVEAFRVRGLIDNTLFVFVGDHGESFGEHGAYVHNNSLYEEEIAVPLVFWSSDGRLRHPDTLVARQVDIAPTVADLMGLENPDFETQGVSLLRTTTCPPVYVGTFFEAVSQALVIDRTKYMFWPSSDRLVRFDLARDPAEVAPMDVHGPERRDILKRLHAAEAYERRIWGP